LRACEAISLFCLPALDNRDRRVTLAMTQLACHCEPAKQSLFSVCQPFTTEIAALRSRPRKGALTGVFVIASLRSNLSFLFASPGQPRSPRYARDDTIGLSLRACEANSLFCLPALDNRDRRATLAMTKLACHCEPAKQSLFSVCQPRKGEIAALRSR